MSRASDDLLAATAGRSADPPWQFQNQTGNNRPQAPPAQPLPNDDPRRDHGLAGRCCRCRHCVISTSGPPTRSCRSASPSCKLGVSPTRRTSSGTRCARTAARTGAASAFTSATSPSCCCSACAAKMRALFHPGRSQVNLMRRPNANTAANPTSSTRSLRNAAWGPRLEMFSRGKRPGWTVWGNQADEQQVPLQFA